MYMRGKPVSMVAFHDAYPFRILWKRAAMEGNCDPFAFLPRFVSIVLTLTEMVLVIVRENQMEQAHEKTSLPSIIEIA